MRRRITTRLFLANLLVLLLAISHGNAQYPTQKPAGYVNDIAGVLSPAVRQQLEALCAELDQKTKAQLAIVTVRSLEGRSLEEFTVDLATKWGIGPKGSDRGVLLFLAIQDRRSRIEVGYGLEPIIPDGRAGSILREMTPYLRNGDYDGAMRFGASTVAQIIAQEAGVLLSGVGVLAPVTPIARPSGIQRNTEWRLALLILLVSFLLAIDRSYFSLAAVFTLGLFSIPYYFTEIYSTWFSFLFMFSLILVCLIGITYSPRNKWVWLGVSGTIFLAVLSRGGKSGGGRGGGFGGGGFGGFGGGSFGGGGASGRW